VARQADDETTFVHVIATTCYSLGVPDQIDQMVEDIENAVAMADRSADPLLQFRIREPMMWAAYQRADITRADAVLAEMEAIGNRLGLVLYRAILTEFLTGRALLAGRADDAEASNELWLELGTAAGYPDTLAGYGGFLRGIRQVQGRVDEIVDLFLAAAQENPSVPALRSAVPAILCQVDRLDEARPLLAVEAANGFDYPYDMTWPAAMANATEAAATLREIGACDTLVKRLAPFANQVLAPSGMTLNGALARPLARAATVLGDYDKAESWFNIAHDIHQRLQAPYWTARGQLDHADLCLAREGDGDRAHARNLVMTATATATEYGCAGLTKRAGALVADL
jgi:tetratricopeptide (TPR) repeat protein